MEIARFLIPYGVTVELPNALTPAQQVEKLEAELIAKKCHVDEIECLKCLKWQELGLGISFHDIIEELISMYRNKK
jgi:hypothetical protein